MRILAGRVHEDELRHAWREFLQYVPIRDIMPTGKRFTVQGMTFFRIASGKIVRDGWCKTTWGCSGNSAFSILMAGTKLAEDRRSAHDIPAARIAVNGSLSAES